VDWKQPDQYVHRCQRQGRRNSWRGWKNTFLMEQRNIPDDPGTIRKCDSPHRWYHYHLCPMLRADFHDHREKQSARDGHMDVLQMVFQSCCGDLPRYQYLWHGDGGVWHRSECRFRRSRNYQRQHKYRHTIYARFNAHRHGGNGNRWTARFIHRNAGHQPMPQNHVHSHHGHPLWSNDWDILHGQRRANSHRNHE